MAPPPSTITVASNPIALLPRPYRTDSMWVLDEVWIDDVIATPQE